MYQCMVVNAPFKLENMLITSPRPLYPNGSCRRYSETSLTSLRNSAEESFLHSTSRSTGPSRIISTHIRYRHEKHLRKAPLSQTASSRPLAETAQVCIRVPGIGVLHESSAILHTAHTLLVRKTRIPGLHIAICRWPLNIRPTRPQSPILASQVSRMVHLRKSCCVT